MNQTNGTSSQYLDQGSVNSTNLKRQSTDPSPLVVNNVSNQKPPTRKRKQSKRAYSLESTAVTSNYENYHFLPNKEAPPYGEKVLSPARKKPSNGTQYPRNQKQESPQIINLTTDSSIHTRNQSSSVFLPSTLNPNYLQATVREGTVTSQPMDLVKYITAIQSLFNMDPDLFKATVNFLLQREATNSQNNRNPTAHNL